MIAFADTIHPRYTSITMADLNPLLDMLAGIESGQRKLGAPDKNDPLDPWGSDPLVSEISSALFASGILKDGNPYSEGAERLWTQFPEDLSPESTQALKDWVFRLTRAERFCAGSIWSVAESGLLGRIVRELHERAN
jgi:hypothetical protein